MCRKCPLCWKLLRKSPLQSQILLMIHRVLWLFLTIPDFTQWITWSHVQISRREEGGCGIKLKQHRKKKKRRGLRIKTSLQKAKKNAAGIRITICITTWGFPALNAISVEATTQRVNLSTPPVKSSPDIREQWKDLKGIGSVFLSPHWCNNAQATVWTWSVLSVSNHVCPTDWMSCIWGGVRGASGLCSPQLLSVQFLRITPM